MIRRPRDDVQACSCFAAFPCRVSFDAGYERAELPSIPKETAKGEGQLVLVEVEGCFSVRQTGSRGGGNACTPEGDALEEQIRAGFGEAVRDRAAATETTHLAAGPVRLLLCRRALRLLLWTALDRHVRRESRPRKGDCRKKSRCRATKPPHVTALHR